MLRLLSLILPFVLRRSGRGATKSLVALLSVYVSLFIGVLFLLSALFVWFSRAYGLDIAFLATGLLLVTPAIITAIAGMLPEDVPAAPKPEVNDPLEALIPETLKADPALLKIRTEFHDHPFIASATAASIGMMLTKDIL